MQEPCLLLGTFCISLYGGSQANLHECISVREVVVDAIRIRAGVKGPSRLDLYSIEAATRRVQVAFV